MLVSRELAARAKAGDKEAMERVLTITWPFAFKIAMKILGDPPSAQDVAQVTCLKILMGIGSYDPRRPFGPWARTIAQRIAIDIYRRNVRWDKCTSAEAVGQLEDESPDQERATRSQQLLHQVKREMSHHNPIYWQVLCMYSYDELKCREIAEMLGLPLGTVMNRIFRARKRAKVVIEREDEVR